MTLRVKKQKEAHSVSLTGERIFHLQTPTFMKTLSSIACAALVAGALLFLVSCETPPTVVTQTTTTTETTEVTRGDRLVAPPTTVVYPSEVRQTIYRNVDDD